jgi:4-hydroxy-4-methyl-2-oxoglutarate aldolase
MTNTTELTAAGEVGALQEQLAQLLALGTSTVYEGSELDCWVDPRLRPVWTSARLAGPAFTVKTVPGDNLALQRGVREAPEGSILVVDAGGLEYGHWGEILTEIAMLRKIGGLVIDGSVRDIDELERVGFPVFASGIAMRHAAKTQPGEIGEPISLAGRTVRTGDIVVADTDGVIVIPRELLDEALAGGQQRAEMERQRLATIRGGQVPPMKVETA